MAVGALAGFAQGLESGFQNYQQAQETKQDIADKKAKVQLDQMTIAEKALPYYQGLYRNNPEAMNNPQTMQAFNQHVGDSLGLHIDPKTGGFPKNFGDITAYNPDAAIKAQSVQLVGLQNNLRGLLTSPNSTPEGITQGLSVMAALNKNLPGASEALQAAASDPIFQSQLTSSFQSKLQATAAKTGLTEEQIQKISTLLPYQVQSEMANANYHNAQAAAIPQRLAIEQERLSQGWDRIGIEGQNLQLRGAEFVQRGQQATFKDREAQYGSLMHGADTALNYAKSIGQMLANNPPTGDGAAAKILDLTDKMNKAVGLAGQLQGTATQIKGLPSYRPPGVPGNAQVNQTFKAGQMVPNAPGVFFTGEKNAQGLWRVRDTKGKQGWYDPTKP